MKSNKSFWAAMAAVALLASCSDDDPIENIQLPLGAYDNGVLILSQGNYMGSNAEVSYLSSDFGTFQNQIFGTVNEGSVLGDTGQDIGLEGDRAYIVLNGSNKIEIVNRYTFAHIATISTGLSNPRYIAFNNGKAYVSNWGDPTSVTDDYIAVIDLGSNSITANIPVAEGPERLLVEDGKLYVAQTGGYGFGTTVSVINLSSNTVTASVPVGDVPNSLVEENGFLYVLCGGVPSWTGAETNGKLVRINLANNNVTGTREFAAGQHPSNLVEDNNKLYYTVDLDIFTTTPSAATLPATPLFSTTPQGAYGVYAMAINNGHIYIGDALDYNSNGKVYVHDLSGALQQTYTVGVIPAGFYFN